MGKRPLTVAITALALLGLGAAALAAGQSRFATEFKKLELETSTAGEDRLSGRLGSDKPRCRRARRVKAYRKSDGYRTHLGGDDTNKKGKFRIELGDGSPRQGKYLAQAPEVSFKSNSGHKTTCLEAKSPTLDVK